MTLNGVMAVILRYFSEFGSFRAHCVKVHVRYLISWWVLVVFPEKYCWNTESRFYVQWNPENYQIRWNNAK